ncbi:MAG: hypothetical protein DMG61_08180 [Acidobacteria bacterium]|nr:MAG: hypothetical protein DMG61_08180 [Acidobacteriota bacterium]
MKNLHLRNDAYICSAGGHACRGKRTFSDPERYGGKSEDAFDVVVPSLPGIGFDGQFERLNRPLVVSDLRRSAVPRCSKRECGRGSRGVVCGFEPPVLGDRGYIGVLEVAIDNRKQVFNLVATCRFRFEPTVFHPLL